MKRVSILLIAFSCAVFVTAQENILRSLERSTPGQGKVTIHQDPRITALFENRAQPEISNGRQVLKVAGYRIQVYAGNNTGTAKNEAYAMGTRIRARFPDLPVYTYFASPRWLCRVGDFASIEEADAAMRQLRATGVFKEVAIVKEQVNIPL